MFFGKLDAQTGVKVPRLSERKALPVKAGQAESGRDKNGLSV